MKIDLGKIVAIAWLCMTASAQALQPEVLYGFQLEPSHPSAGLTQGMDGNFYGTTAGFSGGPDLGSVFQVTTNGLLTKLVTFTGDNGANPRAGLTLGSDGNFYGTTEGGSSGAGTVFKVTANGILTTLITFNGTNGANPRPGLVLGSDGQFYGSTTGGGGSDHGMVFKITTKGVLTTLVSLTASDILDHNQMVLGSDGDFYGTTEYGGSSRHGTVFKMTTNGVVTTLVSFNGANGNRPQAGLVLGRDGRFYGTTSGKGTASGTVFQVTTNGVLTTLASFTDANLNVNGVYPSALVMGIDGNFYGTTSHGGSGGGYGTIFKITTGGVLTMLISFSNGNGAAPEAGLALGADGNLYGTTSYGGSDATGRWTGAGTVFKLTTTGELKSLVSFRGSTNGSHPGAELVWGKDGDFYGTTSAGGRRDLGTVFKVTRDGVLTTLVEFNGTNGANPGGGLLLAGDGSLYGTTTYGGNRDRGTVFRLATNGSLTTLVDFTFENGAHPEAGLVFGWDGNLYGTTRYGGSALVDGGYGTVFQVTTNGVLTSVVPFTGDNGANPRTPMVVGIDGSFYGTTGGTRFGGGATVFRMTTNGSLTSLASFNGDNGRGPVAGLVLGSDGTFYGTTSGGENVFNVTTNGVLVSLASFTGDNGANPQGRLLLGRDGNLYGTTASGGNYFEGNNPGYGTVFRVTPNGVLTSLFSFNGYDGANPRAGLVLGNDGYCYGTTSVGGAGGGGTIFRVGIAAFTNVARQPNGSVLLAGNGPINGSYRLWARPDLSLPLASWTLLRSASFDSSGNFSYADAGASTNRSRLYQLSIP